MGGLVGWHLLILLSVLALLALAVWGVYWIARLGARRGTAEASRRREE
ncbi:hypothetical protein [Microbacterium ulmi]|uniref:Uncharacterized protein n=1 Tax=Microbacterium ulmi TaxID=179095 RepID=A0A7Y2LWQ9_9MICO|nr:hypothetical protein [Microbacterium ulmi]NII68252.1 ABC-type transporter Mla subunit MlaD [Microbacterium ulmi]NNH02271.1 hypothetical protein [Microbacterium ulmi]